MGSAIYGILEQIFGPGATEDIKSFIKTAFEVLTKQFSDSNGIVSTALAVMAGISCALLALYFFMSIVDQASRDMFTLEKLIIAFIKMLAAFVLLIELAPLMNGLVTLGKGFYDMSDALFVSEDTVSDNIPVYKTKDDKEFLLSMNPEEETWGKNGKEQISEDYSGWKGFKRHFGFFALSFFFFIAMIVTSGAALFLVVSNTLQIIIRGICSPIAVVQLFDEGMRSSGIRYVKKFAALCLTFMMIIIILKAGTTLTASFAYTDELEEINEGNINTVLNAGTCLMIIIARIATIGAMFGAGKIADEVLGA